MNPTACSVISVILLTLAAYGGMFVLFSRAIDAHESRYKNNDW